MEKIFNIPLNCGFGTYRIIGNSSNILQIHYVETPLEKDKTDNAQTLDKINTNCYPSHLINCFEELIDFFQGKIKSFESAKFICFKGTDFQNKVWRKMLEIPYGKTITYGELATMVGESKAYRAIGSACGKNPCEIIIPCHRIVGKKSIGGFRNGIEKKKTLLDLEKKFFYISSCTSNF